MHDSTSYLEPSPDQPRTGILSWLLTTDHKRIGLMYLAVIGFWFTVAVILGMIVRAELELSTELRCEGS